jgi:hypothetical protein
MPLYCPFCHANEADRVHATAEDGKQVVLVMFDCPFFMRMDPQKLESELVAQNFLNEWRFREGESWLESLGSIMKQREQKNIARYLAGKSAS